MQYWSKHSENKIQHTFTLDLYRVKTLDLSKGAATRRAFGEYMEGAQGAPSTPGLDRMASKFSPAWLGKGYFGSMTTGVISFADMNANEDGYNFYDELASSFNRWDGGGKFSDVFKFQFGNWDYKKWNEQIVPSSFIPYVVIDNKIGI